MFPACAGVNLNYWNLSAKAETIPRIRGGEPKVFLQGTEDAAYPPRARG